MTEDKQTTKDRLLDAAERLFASKAYANVSIRELAAAAGVNVAAVNYHFQGKDNLYREVILRRFVAQREHTLAALDTLLGETDGKPDVAQVIEALVGQYLSGVLAATEYPTFLILLGREMMSPKPHDHGTVFKELIAPVFQAYSEALMRACPDLDQEAVNWYMASIVGQLHHFVFRRRKWESLPEDAEPRIFMKKAFPALALPTEEYVRAVTDHITRFSTAAIKGLRGEVNS